MQTISGGWEECDLEIVVTNLVDWAVSKGCEVVDLPTVVQADKGDTLTIANFMC